jgi:hypothetical protein
MSTNLFDRMASGMEKAERVASNLSDAERRIQETVCPVYGVDARERPQLIGSSIPLSLSERIFLVTAAHVFDENKDTTLYVGGVDSLVELAGTSFRTRAPLSGRQDDTLDFGFIDISETPRDQWSRYRFVTPEDFDVDDVPTEHTLYAFAGYPETRNKRLPGRNFRLSTTVFVLMPTPFKRYRSLRLNPRTHFVGNFSRNKQLDSMKRVVVGPDPHGVSGGGVWRIGRPDELAAGIGIEYRSSRSVLVGVRVSLLVAAFKIAYPDLSELLPNPALIHPVVDMQADERRLETKDTGASEASVNVTTGRSPNAGPVDLDG